jgi:hypothetical protein
LTEVIVVEWLCASLTEVIVVEWLCASLTEVIVVEWMCTITSVNEAHPFNYDHCSQ